MPMRTLQKKWGGKEMVLDHQKIEVKLQCPRRSIGHGVQGSVSLGLIHRGAVPGLIKGVEIP